jgi:hypothetical protein
MRMANPCYQDEWGDWICDKPRALGLRAMGDLSDVLDAVSAGQAIATDPGLPETVQLALRLKNVAAREAVASGQPPSTSPGIGLGAILPYLRLYVQSREQSWILPAVIVAAIGLPFLLGVAVGRR